MAAPRTRRIVQQKEAQTRNTDAGSIARPNDWTQQLTGSVSIKLDTSGNGIATLGPQITREYWELTQASVSVSTIVLEALCTVSLGVGGTAVQTLDTTRSGSSGDNITFGSVVLDVGATLIAQWTGGDAGSYATLRLYGTKRRYGN